MIGIEHAAMVRRLMAFGHWLLEARLMKESTVGSKFAAVAHFHKVYAGVDLPTQHPLLKSMRKGMNKIQGDAGNINVPK